MESKNKKGFSKNLWVGITDHACPQCGRPLAVDLPKGEVCDVCAELNLFSEVRDYIRGHEVNEYEVAMHFDIPLSKIKKWIEEGRIEYKEEEGARFLVSGRCEICGAPIAFGSLCTKCKRSMNDEKKKGFAILQPNEDAGKMRFRENK